MTDRPTRTASGDAPGELVELRRDLRELKWYVSDDGLWRQITAWVRESYRKDDAETAQEFVENALNSMLARNPMYHKPGLERPAEGFPEECDGCPHVESACPVLRDRVETRWRARQLEQAESESEARRVYQQQAIDTNCQRIPELLAEYDESHAPFIQAGQELLVEAERELRSEEILETDDALDEPDLGVEDLEVGLDPDGEDTPAEALPDGGSNA